MGSRYKALTQHRNQGGVFRAKSAGNHSLLEPFTSIHITELLAGQGRNSEHRVTNISLSLRPAKQSTTLSPTFYPFLKKKHHSVLVTHSAIRLLAH